MSRPKGDIDRRIVKAARKRFLEKGVDGASLRDIARAAKTSIGMVYYYFPHKDDLFMAVVEETYEKLLVDLAAALDKELPVPERLRRLSLRVAAMSEAEIDVIRMVVREALSSTRRLESLFQRFRRGHLPLLLAAARDGFSRGEIDPRVHPAVALMSFHLMALPQLMARAVRRLEPDLCPPPADELATALADVLFHGLAPKTGNEK